MSFEFGFCKYSYDDPNYNLVIDKYYWTWCGWENTDFFNSLARLTQKGFIRFGEEGVVAFKDLTWINALYIKVSTSPYYHMISQLSKLDYDFANDYLEGLSNQELAEFRASFVIDHVSDDVYEIIGHIVKKITEDGSFSILQSLYDGYKKMQRDGVKSVYLYNS